MDLLFCSRYPFSPEARALVESRRPEIDARTLEKAKERAIAALVKGELGEVTTKIEGVLMTEVVTYPVSKMLVASLKSRYFSGRYAVAESKRVGVYLRKADDSELARVAGGLGLNVVYDGGWAMSFQDYLEQAPRTMEYKLINKRLTGGRVFLGRNEFVRVLEEAVRKRIEGTMPRVELVPECIRKAAEEVRRALPKETARPAKFEGAYPPCIVRLMERLRESENLPHTARWYLATFLLAAGMERERIVDLFRTAPDWDEKITRYQVDFIAKKGYRVPGCASVNSYGLCCANCRVGNPMNYGKMRKET